MHSLFLLFSLSNLSQCVTYLRDENFVTSLHTHGYPFAVLVESAGPDSKHIGLIEFLDAAFRQEDAAGGAGFGFDSLDEHAVQQGDERFDGFQSGGLLGCERKTLRLAMDMFI